MKQSYPNEALFDSKCFDLAEEFLSDTDTFHIHNKARCNELAALIQQTIEDFIADALSNYEPSDTSTSEPDDSSYRRDMINAGRGHLLK